MRLSKMKNLIRWSSVAIVLIGIATVNVFSAGAQIIPPVTPPPVDTTPPVISGIVTTSVSSIAENITWITDELVVSTFQYGTTTSYGSSVTLSTSAAIGGTTALTGLQPNTTYYYCITATDTSGNSSNYCGHSFTTPAAPDTTPPVISGAAEASLLATEATIVWSTNELATSSLEYGTTQSYGSQATLPASALLAHAATILDLAPGTTYYYCIHATDFVGNMANSCGHSFMTAAASSTPDSPTSSPQNPLDSNPPTISLITLASVATSSATVIWTTNEVANGQIEYGLTQSYGTTTPLDTNLSLTHSTNLIDLQPNTTYHFRIRSSDEIGNVAVSNDETFTTNALGQIIVTTPSDTTPLVIGGTPVQPTSTTVLFLSVEAQSISTSTVTITWTTDLPADSQVEYGMSSALGQTSALPSLLTMSHSITLTGLQSNANYYYRVVSKPAGAPVATTSGPHEFNTLAVSELATVPAVMSNIDTTNVGTSTATVSWTTDKTASGQVFYGITTAYPQQTAFYFDMGASHDFTLTNLTPGILYHYRVRSTDAANNITYSDDYTFTTSIVTQSVGVNIVGGSNSGSAPAALTIVTTSTDQNSITLDWQVGSAEADTAAEYDIRYGTAPITEENFANASQDQTTLVTYENLAPNGTARTYVVAGLNPDTTYYFAVKSRYGTGSWSAISNIPSGATLVLGTNPTGDETPQEIIANQQSASGGGYIHVPYVSAGGGSGAVSGLITPPTAITATGEDSQITLAWNDPNQISFVRTMIVRNANGYPTSPTDGQVVYEGNAETFTDTGLVNGTTYYYALYVYDRAKHYSLPVRVALAPKAGVVEYSLNETPTITAGVQYHFTQVFTQGDTNPEISHLQETLSRYGYYPENFVTSYFGSLTKAALKRFQSAHGVAQTGIVDAKTQMLLNVASLTDQTMQVPQNLALYGSGDMQLGSSGDNVAALQQFLAYEGSYPEAQITGYFGKLTQQAVITFQKQYGIFPTVGYVGPITRHTIEVISGF